MNVTKEMIAAYQNAKELAKTNIQGFHHEGHHYVTDMRKPPEDQIIWEVKYITDYDAGHGAMMKAIDRFVAIEAIKAALSHADHGGVKVKALEWKFTNDNGVKRWSAVTPFGHYFEHLTDRGGWWSSWRLPALENQFDSIEAAKAAAQADYEARILSALTQAPAPTLMGEVETPAPVTNVAGKLPDEKPDAPVENRPEWIWYCGSTSGVPVVTFGRWPKHPQQARYKLAEIQPTEHDHPAPQPKEPRT